MKTTTFLILTLLCSLQGHTQSETLRVCTYNILNYGNSANTYSSKNLRLRPILQAIQPSLTCFNEVSTAVPGLLDTLLQVMPFSSQHGGVHNTTSTTQLDGLFWRQGKFHLLRDTIICSDVRDIVAYELFYEYRELYLYNDTTKLIVITAHLKSSNSSADRAARAGETQKVSAYLASLGEARNIIMFGDFNLYTSSETAYQNLTNPSNANARLNDPLNRPGGWDNNATFAEVHTQSPRLAVLSDGGASGGMDSRFDFILVSDPILSGSRGMRYLSNTYTAFGNDGRHYGVALTDPPTNSAVPQTIAQALYECSDHLPVFADFSFTPLHLVPPAAIAQIANNSLEHISVTNPFEDKIILHVNRNVGTVPLRYTLSSIEGSEIQKGLILSNSSQIELLHGISPGAYILKLENGYERTMFRLMHW